MRASDPRVLAAHSRVCGAYALVHRVRTLVRAAEARAPAARARVFAPRSRVGAAPPRVRSADSRVWVKAGAAGADAQWPRVAAAAPEHVHMSTRFLPTRESVLNTWLENFSARISAAPAAYGLSAGDAAVIAAAVTDWKKAYETAAAPATRTQPAVADKRAQKKRVVAVVRGYAGLVRSNESISSALKIDLGLRLRARRGSPVPVPQACPVLAVRHIGVGTHDLWAGSSGTAPRRGKPAGAAALMVFRAVGQDPVSRAEEAQFLTLVTKTAFTSTFDHSQRGQTATYFARWINAKGEPGPWSTAMIAAIAA